MNDLDPNEMEPGLLENEIQHLTRDNAWEACGRLVAVFAVAGAGEVLMSGSGAWAVACFALILALIGGTEWEERRRRRRLWHLKDALRRKALE